MQLDRDFHARLTVYDIPTMSAKEVHRLVEWMRETALEIEKDPGAYSHAFVARLMKEEV